MQKIGLAGPEGKWFDCQVRRYGRLLAAFEVSPNGQTSSVPVLVGYDASGKDATDFDRLTVRMSEATRTDEVKALGKDISGSPFRGDFAVNYRMAALLHDVADAKTAKPYADIALVAAVLARDELAKTFSVAIGSNNVAMVQSMNWSLAFAKCVTEDIQRKFPPDLHSLPISAPSIAPPIRTSPVGSRKSAASKGANLPPFDQPLVGPNEVRVRNPNEFAVQVGVRSGNKGKDFQVAASGVASISVPDGKYDIYFVYSDNPEALYQGDSFTLSDNGVEIQIVKVVNGNYGIRRVR
jgi:hypothetical protein